MNTYQTCNCMVPSKELHDGRLTCCGLLPKANEFDCPRCGITTRLNVLHECDGPTAFAIAAMRHAIRFLAHPDVIAMPWAGSPTMAAERCRQAIAELTREAHERAN